ncbi:MAG: hypothetical protein Fur0022_28850 [Anaerolineales bacterium]
MGQLFYCATARRGGQVKTMTVCFQARSIMGLAFLGGKVAIGKFDLPHAHGGFELNPK